MNLDRFSDKPDPKPKPLKEGEPPEPDDIQRVIVSCQGGTREARVKVLGPAYGVNPESDLLSCVEIGSGKHMVVERRNILPPGRKI